MSTWEPRRLLVAGECCGHVPLPIDVRVVSDVEDHPVDLTAREPETRVVHRADWITVVVSTIRIARVVATLDAGASVRNRATSTQGSASHQRVAMRGESPMSIRIEVLPRDIRSAVECNAFLTDERGLGVVVPNSITATTIYNAFPGIPAPVTVVARASGRIVAAVMAWVALPLLEALICLDNPPAARKMLIRTRMISFMSIDAAHQGVGIGRQLVDRMELECAADGVSTLFGFVEDFPEKFLPFFIEMGYRVLPPGCWSTITTTSSRPGGTGDPPVFEKILAKES